MREFMIIWYVYGGDDNMLKSAGFLKRSLKPATFNCKQQGKAISFVVSALCWNLWIDVRTETGAAQSGCGCVVGLSLLSKYQSASLPLAIYHLPLVTEFQDPCFPTKLRFQLGPVSNSGSVLLSSG